MQLYKDLFRYIIHEIKTKYRVFMENNFKEIISVANETIFVLCSSFFKSTDPIDLKFRDAMVEALEKVIVFAMLKDEQMVMAYWNQFAILQFEWGNH